METTANFTSEIILLQEYTANPSSANKYARLNTSLGGKYWSNHRPAPPPITFLFSIPRRKYKMISQVVVLRARKMNINKIKKILLNQIINFVTK